MSNPRAPISVLDNTLTKLVEVDCYKTAYFEQSLSDYGSFEIQINWNIIDAAGFRYAEYFTIGRFVLIGTDGNKCGQILEVEKKIDEGGKGSQIVSVRGKQAKIIFSQRVVEPPAGYANYTQTAVAETVMKTVTAAQLGSTATASRQISIINIPTTAGLGASFTYSSRYKRLDSDLTSISQATGLGFNLQLNLSTKKLDFVVISGVNRTASQTTNPRCIISTDFDTLRTGSIKDSYVLYKNLIIAAGQGVGESRNVRKVYSGTEPTGIARRETFADMRDLSTNADIDARGASILSANGVSKFIDASALSYSQYVLGVDYNLGDFITISAYDESQDVQITSIKETWSPASYDISIGFNRGYPELSKVQSAEYQATAQALNNSEPPMSGSNANGNWIKYPDGTMEQWGNIDFTTASSTTTDITVGALPLLFANTASPTLTWALGWETVDWSTRTVWHAMIISGYGPAISGRYTQTGAGRTTSIRWHAIGKWK
jgi:hypothetical protein